MQFPGEGWLLNCTFILVGVPPLENNRLFLRLLSNFVQLLYCPPLPSSFISLPFFFSIFSRPRIRARARAFLPQHRRKCAPGVKYWVARLFALFRTIRRFVTRASIETRRVITNPQIHHPSLPSVSLKEIAVCPAV